MSERNLYEVTGDIKDINTMLVSREEWNRRAQPAQAGQVLTDRHTLQAQGKHPAPCARFCEANAFRAEARELTRLAQPITSLTITERARLLTAADHLEGNGHFMDCADAEWAAQWLRRLLPNTP